MFDNEQNKTMIVHYIKVKFYLSIVKLCHYEEQSDEVIQYRYNKTDTSAKALVWRGSRYSERSEESII